MILIFSIPDDRSTFKVCEWLDFYNIPYFLIFSKDSFVLHSLSITSKGNHLLFSLNNQNIDLKSVKGVWYRRGRLPYRVPITNFKNDTMRQHIKEENQHFYDFMLVEINKLPHINQLGKGNVNKLNILNAAVNSGLYIPHTFITNRKDKIIEFKNKQKSGIISKTIAEIPMLDIDGSKYSTSTVLINSIDDKLSNDIGITLVQEAIQKEFEIRTFYFFGQCYSMAIFSQSNERTKVDFRNYDNEKPNRNIPFQLDRETEQKIKNLMESIDMNCGSIDFIKSVDGKIIFLEVNPVGQYDMVSYPCNYNLHHLIAQKLKEFYEQ